MTEWAPLSNMLPPPPILELVSEHSVGSGKLGKELVKREVK